MPRSLRSALSIFLFTAVFPATMAWAQPSIVESEPNETPADAGVVAGDAVIIGSLAGSDQDAYLWTVSDVDALKRWTFELRGVPGRLTLVEVIRLEYADNGVDVTGYDKLMKLGSRDGLNPVIRENLLFEPGEYLLGIAGAGGGDGGIYRPPAASITFGEEAEAGIDAAPEPGGYRLLISEGKRLPIDSSPKARDSRETAHKARLGSETAALLESVSSWYRFDFSKQEAGQRWNITAQIPVGRKATAQLIDSSGATLASAKSDAHGRLLFADLAPPTAPWWVDLQKKDADGYIHAIVAEKTGQRVTGEEAEPNGSWELANRVDLSQPVTARFGTKGEADYFRFTLDEVTTDQYLAFNLDNPSGGKMRFCLLDSGGTQVQCRDISGNLSLGDLVLPPGEWGLSVSRGAEGTAYSITLETQGAIDPAREAEPNDAIKHASSVPANNRIKGRFSGKETDYYRFVVTDEPQLWRFQVIGDGIGEVGYHDIQGTQVMRVRPKSGQRRIRLDNVFLLPGVHYLKVYGKDGGEYTVLARPVGPPDPNGEREPNNDTYRMTRLAIGQTRTGLLTDAVDSDMYRFFVGHWDHLRLTLTPPADGTVRANLYWYGSNMLQGLEKAPGEPLVLEGLFPPGDYHFSLAAPKPSDAEYRVSIERLPRFDCPADCEPNGRNSLFTAAPLPADFVMEGVAGDWRDYDVFELPVFDQPTEIIVHPPTPNGKIKLAPTSGSADLLSRDKEANVYRATLPAKTPQRLYISDASDGYRLEVEFPNGPQPRAIAPLPGELSLSLDTTTVSAYRTAGQLVTGKVKLKNTSDGVLMTQLEAVTSDFRWKVKLERTDAIAARNGTALVPFELIVPADAWADRPVRVSVRAIDANGNQLETWQEVTVDREARAVNPTLFWDIPEALRGGFNLAYSGLGGRLHGEYTGALGNQFQLVHDDQVNANVATRFRGGHKADEPRMITVELAGDQPVPVAGFAFNLFGVNSIIAGVRDAVLSLSLDGTEFEQVATVTLQPVKTEQHVVLEQPVPARFARISVMSTFYEKPAAGAALAEWKVITEPGFDVTAGQGFNIALPELGGHIVWSTPHGMINGNRRTNMLTEESENPSIRLRKEEDAEWVLGFQHNRAALITGIEWVHATKASVEQRFRGVTVAVSLESPVGPWLPLGEWDISTDQPEPLLLESPTWARFVKFTAQGPDAREYRYLPDTLRVWETPTSAEYTSILTEWGTESQSAHYELIQGLPVEASAVTAGNETRDQAVELAPGTSATGSVSLGEFEHWYRIPVPAGQNTLKLTVSGDPTVRTALRLENTAGEPLPLRPMTKETTPAMHVFEAVVDPGASYWVNVQEPPRNVVFSWDTSASVGPYIPVIYDSLAAFSGEVIPGREAVNLAPFGRDLLLDEWYGEPYMLQTILNDYPRSESSSSAEDTLRRATEALAPLPGTKAILVMTDAATPRDSSLWDAFREVQPRVFGIGVSGSMDTSPEQNLFQDWSRVNGGHFHRLVYRGEMEVAFDRAATMMRRPAAYTVSAQTEFREAPGPGILAVLAGDSGEQATVGNAGVELILDASGSMLQRLDGKRRIVIAKEVLAKAVTDHIPPGTPVALRVFGHKQPNACRTDLEIPLAPLDPGKTVAVINGIQAMNLAKTPIADSLAAVESDLAGVQGRAAIVLVTDGEETCEGDPAAAIEALQAKGIDVNLNIVGFAIGDKELESQFADWAKLGGGRYFSANNQQGLDAAIQEALQVPFTVFDQAGEPVATGLVDGEPIELEQGFYRVEVASGPPQQFEKVEVTGGDSVTLQLDKTQ